VASEQADVCTPDPDPVPDAASDPASDPEPVPELASPDAPEVPDPAPDAGPPPFALLSLNLHCLKLDGTPFATNEARLDAIADEIAVRDVRAVTIQEACRKGNVDAFEQLRAVIETRTGTTWTATWAEAHVAWQGTPDEAIEGLGVLSAGTLTPLPVMPFHVQGGLKRIAVGAVLPPELHGLRLWSVHLEFQDLAARTAQARQVAAETLAEADPGAAVVVGGDFNDIEGSPPHAALAAFGFLDLTDGLPADRIDHLFVHRGAPFDLVDATKVFDGVSSPTVSDHPGVLARIRPGPGESLARTRIVANVDPGPGGWLAIRGNLAPLSWDAGWPARQVGPSTWKLVLTGIAAGAPFAFKCLKDDEAFQTGPDVAGEGGKDLVVTPVF
jgi:endonuclease/exonuclease/phosphatase family metal-dependent hydrolase